jgi:citrate synthase
VDIRVMKKSNTSQNSQQGPDGLIDAATAAKRLGVSRKTLYAYVSRNIVHSVNHPNSSRTRLYDASEIDSLLSRKAQMHQIKTSGTTALDRGLPLLRTSLTRIENGRLHYRNWDALKLADRSSLEDVAGILWSSGGSNPFQGIAFDPARISGWLAAWRQLTPNIATERALTLLPWLLPKETVPAEKWHAWSLQEAAWVVQGLAAAIAGSPELPNLALHEALAIAWGNPSASDPIRRTLVLCADQELNASTFAVRLITTTGAKIAGALIAGLTALSGPKHGGATERIRALLFEIETLGNAPDTVSARLERGDDLPGFGHPLYPNGDSRAAAILQQIKIDDRLAKTIEAVAAITGLRPSLDLALVAVERTFRLPRGTALALFAIGRSVGWIAHALEQRVLGNLIRPGSSMSPAGEWSLTSTTW